MWSYSHFTLRVPVVVLQLSCVLALLSVLNATNGIASELILLAGWKGEDK